MRRAIFSILTLGLIFLCPPAKADSLVVLTCGTLPLAYHAGATRLDTVDINGNKCVNATVTASVTGFTPNGNFANLTATGSSASVALPVGTVVQFQNTGTTAVSCTLGIGSATAAANEIVIQSGSTKAVVVGSNTFGACIDQTGSASNVVVLAGGAGLANDSGGGGGGSGGSVTQGTTPWVDSITTWAGGTLGAMANYGTSPGAVLVPGVNAFITGANTSIIPPLGQTTLSGGTPVSPASDWVDAVKGQVNVTPNDCSGTITSGGTAQNAIAANAGLHGFTIANIDASAGSGEPVWFSFTTTAAASTAASYPLAAPTATTFANLASYTTPLGFGTNHAVSIIGTTTGHKFSCTYW